LNTSLAAAAGELWQKEGGPVQWPVLALKGSIITMVKSRNQDFGMFEVHELIRI